MRSTVEKFGKPAVSQDSQKLGSARGELDLWVQRKPRPLRADTFFYSYLHLSDIRIELK